jgi:hypothetical protein
MLYAKLRIGQGFGAELAETLGDLIQLPQALAGHGSTPISRMVQLTMNTSSKNSQTAFMA